jgi:hypothetical protein
MKKPASSTSTFTEPWSVSLAPLRVATSTTPPTARPYWLP